MLEDGKARNFTGCDPPPQRAAACTPLDKPCTGTGVSWLEAPLVVIDWAPSIACATGVALHPSMNGVRTCVAIGARSPRFAPSNFRDPLTDILLHGGSGMRKTCDRVHLCPPGAREDCALPGAPAAPSDLRARVDRQVRRPHAAQLRDRRAARLPRVWHLGARLGTTFLPHLPRALCCGLELQGSRVLSKLWRPTHERGRADSGRPRPARSAHPTVRGHGAFPAEISVGLRRETA